MTTEEELREAYKEADRTCKGKSYTLRFSTGIMLSVFIIQLLKML